jgi:acyl-coenzyme A thioesterase PaaI-like protein
MPAVTDRSPQETADQALYHLGFTPWAEDADGWRHTSVEIGSQDCIEGTERPLTGVLFAYLDIVMGSPPSGSMNPTVDLQLRLLGEPRSGMVHFRARTLRLGRMLYVGEAELTQDGHDGLLGVGLGTFLNQQVPFPDRIDLEDLEPYSLPAGARRTGPGTFDLAADTHTPQGTVPGADLGLFAEMAARDVLGTEGGPVAVDEFEVRFLHKVKGERIRSTATVLGTRGDATTVRVDLVDVDHDRLVTYALAVCRPVRRS